jgi:predicted esterase
LRAGVAALQLHRAIGVVKLAGASQGRLLVLLHGSGGCCHQLHSVLRVALIVPDTQSVLLACCSILVGVEAARLSHWACRLGLGSSR